jgi:hypothetical protein
MAIPQIVVAAPSTKPSMQISSGVLPFLVNTHHVEHLTLPYDAAPCGLYVVSPNSEKEHLPMFSLGAQNALA